MSLDLAIFRKSERLHRLASSFTVDAEGEECCLCDRAMAPGEIGYGGDLDYWGEPNDWYCRRCAYERFTRYYQGKYDAEWCRRAAGGFRYSRAANKALARIQPTGPRHRMIRQRAA